MKPIRTFLVAGLLAAACSREPAPTHEPARPAGAEEHQHEDVVDLGAVQVAGRTVQANRGRDLQPGAEADVDLDFPGNEALPATVRGWIGGQDAAGCVKSRFGREGDRCMHAHVEVPKPLPTGSRLWIEIEADGGRTCGSFDLKQ